MAFTGKALYDSGVFTNVREDVSDLITSIAPVATPLLDMLGTSDNPATSVYHEWEEEDLSPNTLVSSMTLAEDATALPVHSGGVSVGGYIMPGAILRHNTTGEYLQVTATSAKTLTVSRAFGGTSAATITAADGLTVIAPAALEGADVASDISRPRDRKSNYCQIFKTDVIISGTVDAVSMVGVESEWDHQKTNRLKTMLRDMEKAVILGKLSGNTLGSASAYRTMKGLWDFVATNATSTGTLTPEVLDEVIGNAWSYGADDLNLIVCDATWKRVIDNWADSRIMQSPSDTGYVRQITQYTSSFGDMPVIVSRWMPSKTLLVLSTDRVKVVPLRNRSFGFEEVARTGDARKGMLVGEYTLEVRNETGLAKAYG